MGRHCRRATHPSSMISYWRRSRGKQSRSSVCFVEDNTRRHICHFCSVTIPRHTTEFYHLGKTNRFFLMGEHHV
jgi:hypothetical protein